MKGFDLSKLRINPSNPFPFSGSDTDWSDFKKKLDRDPEFLEANKIAYDSSRDNLVIAGNKRVQGLRELGWKSIPSKYVIDCKDWSEEKRERYIYASNWNIGQWSVEFTDEEQAQDWGIIFNDIDIEDIETFDEFSLPDGDKPPFQQMTFTLADEQAEQLKNSLADIKQTEEYKYVETFGNENSNANALYLIISQWAEQRK